MITNKGNKECTTFHLSYSYPEWLKSFSSLDEVCFSSFSYTVSKYNFSDVNSCSYETSDNEYTQFKPCVFYFFQIETQKQSEYFTRTRTQLVKL